MAKQAPKHQTYYIHSGLMKGEEHIRVSTGREYWSFDGHYYPRRDSAEAHLKSLVREHELVAGIRNWSQVWGIRVFKTQKGWGVFLQV